ncbi:MAG: hypothetical protein BJ554DRAFT_5456 [Olpidium bornovanus]|uniref:Uncharacterized protein n=1 Tax=Olpidium bornovanus TaxID=278681 RepID=A0A8H8A085_9FUNG|nr:MAG: hypothetical protein BJ554DRAFT_5456 [Olpidium bornovanus]
MGGGRLGPVERGPKGKALSRAKAGTGNRRLSFLRQHCRPSNCVCSHSLSQERCAFVGAELVFVLPERVERAFVAIRRCRRHDGGPPPRPLFVEVRRRRRLADQLENLCDLLFPFHDDVLQIPVQERVLGGRVRDHVSGSDYARPVTFVEALQA